jgi:hypothetical protein
MSKKLPNLYVNKIDKKLNNNDNVFYTAQKPNILENESLETQQDADKIDVKTKINKMFSSPNFVYKMNVTLILKDKSTITKDVIGQIKDKIITIDEESIKIDDIKDIKF